MLGQSWPVALGGIAAALTILTTLLTLLALAWRGWRTVHGKIIAPIELLLRDVRGEPARPLDGVPERPGFGLRLARIEQAQAEHGELLRGLDGRLRTVESELYPNGGTSLRDAVDATRAAVSDVHGTIVSAGDTGRPGDPRGR